LSAFATRTNKRNSTHARRQKETEEDITAAHEGREKKARKKSERTIDSIERKSKKQVTSFFCVVYSVVVVFGALYQSQHVTFLDHTRVYLFCTRRYTLKSDSGKKTVQFFKSKQLFIYITNNVCF